MIHEIELNLDETPAPVSTEDLRGVLLPLNGTQLLLPNVTVSEVIGYRDPSPVANAPGWMMGSLTWRQRKVPVITFEYFVLKEAAEPGYRSRIALCHNLAGNPEVPYIGILCNSIPKLARVNTDTIDESMLQEFLPEMTLKHLTDKGEDAWIPDIEALGKAAAGYL